MQRPLIKWKSEGMGNKTKETKESEELKTVRMKPRCDFSVLAWEITAKGNGASQRLLSEWGRNSPSG